MTRKQEKTFGTFFGWDLRSQKPFQEFRLRFHSFLFFLPTTNSIESQIKSFPIIVPYLEIIWKHKGQEVFIVTYRCKYIRHFVTKSKTGMNRSAFLGLE